MTTKKLKVHKFTNTDFRTVILRRLKELDTTRYALTTKAGLDVGQSNVYRFLEGYDMRSSNLEEVLRALGIGLVVLDSKPKWVKKRA